MRNETPVSVITCVRVDELLIRHYLLGDLPGWWRAPLERRMLADNEFYEILLAFEEELIDEYVRGELLGRKRERFEKLYLDAPRRRRQIEFART